MKNVFASDLSVLLSLIGKDQLSFVVYDPQKKLINNTAQTIPLLKQGNENSDVLFIVSGNLETKGYRFIVDFTNTLHGKTLRYFNNTDGTMRWLWPTELKKPTFLSFYNSTYKTAKALRAVIKTAFLIGLSKQMASGAFTISGALTYIEELGYAEDNKHFSLFTGTIGPNRKCLIELGDGKRTQRFVKLPVGEAATALVDNEKKMMRLLNQFSFEHLNIPVYTNTYPVAAQSNIKPQQCLVPTKWNNLHTNALANLYELGVDIAPLNNHGILHKAMYQINEAANNPNFKQVLHAEAVCHELMLLIEELMHKDLSAPMGIMHGDFTPWNMYETKDNISLYDWEMGKTNMPLLFDLFHYIIQKGVLIQHNQTHQIELELHQALHQPEVKKLIELYQIDVDLHLKLYLVHTSSYYLHVYSQQPSLHMQVEWLMQNWLNMLLAQNAARKTTNMRATFVPHFFASIKHKNYRVLKHVGKTLADYSTHSDIDLLVKSEDVKTIIDNIKNAFGVCKLKVVKKSFMCIVQVYFSDGSFISIDLLTGFKRKTTYFLQASEWLNEPAFIENGMKVPGIFQAYEYIILFSVLNGADIPERYRNHFKKLSAFVQRMLPRYFAHKYQLDITDMEDLFYFKRSHQTALTNLLRKKRENKSFRKFIHAIHYLSDTLKDIYSKKGLVITFSGVDGAGKSTILEEVKKELETSYRRKVVVLRHRPSILPILSVYKYGKEAAHQKVINSLPRQGTNKSKWGSALRFAYYYADYALGQLYVYVKHVLKGHVVLYDRYYYDFIADPQRSNIKISSGITRFLFNFIQTPHVNFFLYAEPEEILKRKQELSYTDIKTLTEKYQLLFKGLAADKHISICNHNKQQTLHTILRAFTKAA